VVFDHILKDIEISEMGGIEAKWPIRPFNGVNKEI